MISFTEVSSFASKISRHGFARSSSEDVSQYANRATARSLISSKFTTKIVPEIKRRAPVIEPRSPVLAGKPPKPTGGSLARLKQGAEKCLNL